MKGRFKLTKRELTLSRLTEEEYCAIMTEKLGRLCNAYCYAKQEDPHFITYYWASRNDKPTQETLDGLKKDGFILLHFL